jgi:hypothetical protein
VTDTSVHPDTRRIDTNLTHDLESDDAVRIKSPATQGEESMGGSASNPESDDDTLESMHAVGLQMDEDEEHPQELDIACDIDGVEQVIRGK